MKARAILMAGMMTLTVMASTRVAQAQDHLVVNVPFDFAAGGATLPAGEYSVKASEASRMLLLINRTNPGVSVVIPANPAQSDEIQTRSRLIFRRYGDRYFLSQVWTEGSAFGKELPQSARERETALSASIQAWDEVVIAASH